MPEKLKIIIVGGGTAGWMCAAALARLATNKVCDIYLVESDDIATVGVGEATVPTMKQFNERLGLSEAEMMKETGATFKLGIEFVDWGRCGSSYIHPFGTFGYAKSGIDFHQLWTRYWHRGSAKPLQCYSFAVQLARNYKFEFPAEDLSLINSTFSYAYHLDAGRYAKYLRHFAECNGVTRKEGKITGVDINSKSGNIETLKLQSGEVIAGDFFIDCSGFRSLLMGKSLGVSFKSWKKWLPCNRAVTIATEKSKSFPPFTQARAKKVGWQWRIPLQHRTGNGYVFSDAHISDDCALQELFSGINGEPITEPRFLSFEAGIREKSWYKNCVSIGLSGGFLEPLESTSIYLIQVAIFNLINLMPDKKSDNYLAEEFNRRMTIEYERVRDFLILHYKLTNREDSEFWRYCKNMEVPYTVVQKINSFKKRGFIEQYRYGLFSPPSWLSVLEGQSGVPVSVEPLSEVVPDEEIEEYLASIERSIKENIPNIKDHNDFIKMYCLMIDGAVK